MSNGEARTARDKATTAGIFGWFAGAWFGWGQAAPPRSLEPWLIAGEVASAVVLVAGIVLLVLRRRTGSALRAPGARRRYGIILGVEFALCGVGAAVLGATGQAEYIPVWISAVVGAHFIPLAAPLRDPSLRPLAVVVLAVSAAALVTGLTTGVDAGAVTGAGAGLALLAWGAAAARGALH